MTDQARCVSAIAAGICLIASTSSIFSTLFALAGLGTVAHFYIARKMKMRYLQAKIERRRSRRSSEESITAKKSSFAH